MDASRVVATLIVLLVVGLYLVAVRAARKHAWTSRRLVALSAVSGLALLVMVLSDWPGEQLSDFWADHSVLAAVLSTVLLVSLGYLAFEAGELREQADLGRSVTAAGLSGLVDRLLDVDIALSHLDQEIQPQGLYDKGRPLEWLADHRKHLQKHSTSRKNIPLDTFVRSGSADLDRAEWRADLISQCVRRIIGGMRDWAALVSVSEDGRTVLKRLGQVRIDLLRLLDDVRPLISGQSGHAHGAIAELPKLRIYLQMFSLALECSSSQSYLRPGLVEASTLHASGLDSSGRFIERLLDQELTIREAIAILDEYRGQELPVGDSAQEKRSIDDLLLRLN